MTRFVICTVCILCFIPFSAMSAVTDDLKELKKMLHGRMGREATVVAFLGVSCPVSNRYVPRLNELSKTYGSQGIAFIGFNSNPGETALETALHAEKYDLHFPVYKDVHHNAADYFGAQKTPEVFLIDKQGAIQYEGRIDGQYGVGHATLPKQGRYDLKVAIDEVLAGKKVSQPKTQAIGCVLTRDYDSQPEITYSKHISRIMQNNCQTCHRPDGVAEFYPWMDYDDVRAMAGMIKQVVIEERMPPWHADPRYGVFSNDRSMSKEDRNALIAWVDAGSPEGDTANLPEPKTYPSQHFTIGEPDHIIRMPQEFDVPADGVVDYQYFMIEQEVKEDLWIQKAEAIMDSPAVHHIILFWVPPGGDPRKNRNMLVGTAPGDMPLDLPDGMAIHVPKGSRFLIEMHYTPIGRPVTDRSFIGLIKAKEEVDRVVYGNPMGRHDFSIPPGKADHKEISKFNVLEDIEVVSFMPHMHVRGKSWKYTALYPDGREEVLLYVPNYDFNWQSVYMYEKNPVLPKGTTIVCEAVWDNSAENPYNPDPAKTVRYGEQTWEEMMFGFMQYVHVDKKFQDNRALSRMDGKKKRKRS